MQSDVHFTFDAAETGQFLILATDCLFFAANGWLTNISDGGTNTIVSYEYDSAGRRTRRTLQNSTFTVLEYDNASQLTNIWHRQISGGATNTISRYQYGFDDAGSRTWVKRANGKGDVYAYDATDQLTHVPV